MTPTNSRGAAIGTGRVPRGCETGVEQDACTAASTDAPASPSRRCGSAARNPPGNQSVGDRWNLAFPIGTGVRLTDEIALDLETVVGNPIRAHGTAGTAIDPASSTARSGRAPRNGSAGTGFIETALPVTHGVPVGKTTAELDLVVRTDIGS